MNKKEQKLNITGMTCNHCVMSVEKALTAVPGVENVTVNLEEKNAAVVYDADATSPDQMIAALDETNYKASI